MERSRYEIIGRLAEGGMAEILLAVQRSVAGFERRVVLKRVLPEYSGDTAFIAAFLDEARLVARLAHPNIVAVIDLGEDESGYYLAMEHVDGHDLSTVLRNARRHKQPLPLPVVLSLMSDVCLALDYAHDAKRDDGEPLGVIHRDVTPSNIIVSREGIAKVLDFGIAKAVGRAQDKTSTGTVKGKIAYLAPEQILAQPIDRRVDVFAAGVTLFELATNVNPFAEDSDFETMKAIAERGPRSLDAIGVSLPPGLVALLERALERDPERRLPSCRKMYEQLQAVALTLNAPVNHGTVRDYLQAHDAELTAAKPKPRLEAPTAEVDAPTVARATPPVQAPAAAPESRPAALVSAPTTRRGVWVALAVAAIGVIGVVIAWPKASPPPMDAPLETKALTTPDVAATLPSAETVSGTRSPTPPAAPVATPTRGPAKAKTKPAAAGMGKLKLLVKPWADVSVDGQARGTTPMLPLELSSGEHVVKLSHPDHPSVAKRVQIRAGETAEVSHRFE